MPAHICEICHKSRAQILRPKNRARICAPCFIDIFEQETASTVESNRLFQAGERVAIGASGGKDSTVLASVLKTLNDRRGWGLDLVLLSIDEGIQGYRDHSLEAVKRNSEELQLPLKIVSYAELYGWSMDQVVAQVGKKGNCTYCGVFRRQALDRGAAMLGVRHVVTGHNADDVAETVLMNLLRGDLPRLGRATSIVTSNPGAAAPVEGDTSAGTDGGVVDFVNVKRSKPLMYAYEKEIVLYAHHKKLDYFSTECIYSPEAFRGSARTLIKNLERIRPESILDVVRSGIDMAKMVPGEEGNAGEKNPKRAQAVGINDDEGSGGCGNSSGRTGVGEMAAMEEKLRQDEVAAAQGSEIEIISSREKIDGQRHDRATPGGLDDVVAKSPAQTMGPAMNVVTIRTKHDKRSRNGEKAAAPTRQRLGRCERCGYLSSQTVCKACVLLEGLNKSRPKTDIEVG